MTTTAESQPIQFPNENMMFAGADPIDDDDLGRAVDQLGDGPIEIAGTEPAEPADVAVEEAEVAEANAAPEAEAEAVEEVEAAAPEPDTKNIQIPKWRLDQEVARRRALEQQLKAKAAAPAAEPVDFNLDLSELEREYADAILDGKIDQATQIRGNINQQIAEATYRRAEENLTSRLETGFDARLAARDFDAVVDDIEARYEVFRPVSQGGDDALIGEVHAIRSGYEGAGYTPSEALRTAVELVLMRHRPDLLAAAAPPGSAAPVPASRAKAVERNIQAANRQPPELPRSEAQVPTINVATLSDEELDALPEATMRRLRGDFL